ncbi:MAG: cytidine deaminase [Actinomycetota bacterium]|nr:cytidine deaminase [Actinomycetota bacterium]
MRPSRREPPLSDVGPEQAEILLARAREARGRAYAPYSGFPVGAAVLTDGGEVHAGANVENASYPLSACAERSAVQRAVSEGATGLVAVAVAGPPGGTVWPCGGCRQVLHEFGPDLLVITEAGDSGPRRQRRLGELLPDSFGPADLD